MKRETILSRLWREAHGWLRGLVVVLMSLAGVGQAEAGSQCAFGAYLKTHAELQMTQDSPYAGGMWLVYDDDSESSSHYVWHMFMSIDNSVTSPCFSCGQKDNNINGFIPLIDLGGALHDYGAVKTDGAMPMWNRLSEENRKLLLSQPGLKEGRFFHNDVKNGRDSEYRTGDYGSQFFYDLDGNKFWVHAWNGQDAGDGSNECKFDILMADLYDGVDYRIAFHGYWKNHYTGSAKYFWWNTYARYIRYPKMTFPTVSVKRCGNGAAVVSNFALLNEKRALSSGTSTWYYIIDFFNQAQSNAQYPGNSKNKSYSSFANGSLSYELYMKGTQSPDGYFSENCTSNMTVNGRTYQAYAAGASSGSLNATMYLKVSNYEPQTIYPCVTRYSDGIGGMYGQDYRVNVHKYYDGVTLKGYPRAKNVTTEYDPWSKKVTLKWDYEVYDENQCNTNGKWAIFREEKGDAQHKTLKRLDSNTLTFTSRAFSDNESDTNVKEYGKAYTYYVVFQPNEWDRQIQSPWDAEELWKSVELEVDRSERVFTMLTASQDNEKVIEVEWEFDSFADASASKPYEIGLYRGRINKNVVPNDTIWDTDPVTTQKVTSTSVNSGSFTNMDGVSGKTTYAYQLRVSAQESIFVSEVAIGTLNNTTRITSVSSSLGTFSNSVLISWDVSRSGDSPTFYTVYRRLCGSTAQWQKLYMTSSTAVTFSYEDQRALAGNYYTYLVEAYEFDDFGSRFDCGSKMTDGFAMASGVISGRVSYGTGTAVEGVKVSLLNSSDANTKSLFHSFKFDGVKSGISTAITGTEAKELLGKAFTLQAYVRPNSDQMSIDGTEYVLLDAAGKVRLLAKYDVVNSQYVLGASIDGATASYSDVAVAADKWSHVSFVHEGSSNKFYVATPDGIESGAVQEKALSTKYKDSDIVLGNAVGMSSKNNFRGHVDEFRLFTAALTEDEISKNYDHRLSGNEEGLAIYWPMDEGLSNQKTVYDNSKTGGLANGRHGKVGSNSISVGYVEGDGKTYDNVPDETRFSLCAYTDINGNYSITGVPFSGEGVAYSVVPTKGVHEFSPAKQNRFVSVNSLISNGVDFTDVSSFTVKGTIYYEGTTYPVEGVDLMVDGIICVKDGNLIETDENGEFEISVPIGWHYITASKKGHTFVNAGRYPAETVAGSGDQHEFTQAMTGLTFYDNTLVPVVGRVAGGNIEGEKPLGFGQSKNNIGQAELVLQASDIYMMNAELVTTEASSRYEYSKKQRVFGYPEKATIGNGAKAFVGATEDSTRLIVVRTDTETGEWAAMLPPLKYTVKSIRLVNGDKSNLSQNGQIVDATNVELMRKDSVAVETTNGTEYEKFEYVASLKTTYRVEPTMVIEQEGAAVAGAFGEEKYSLKRSDGKTITKALYSKEGDETVYTFGYPVFLEMQNYDFKINLYEKYTNIDNGEEDMVPLSNVTVTFGNEMGVGNVVVYDADKVEGDYKDGDILEVDANEVTTDEEGKAKYSWTAGMPNIQAPYTRTMTVTYDLDGTQKTWSGSGFAGIVLGNLPTGNNFMTAGTDKVDMILRDPPGTNSQSWWEKGATVTSTVSRSWHSSSATEITTVTSIGADGGILVGGVGAGRIDRDLAETDLTVGMNVNLEASINGSETRTVSTTKKISTSDGSDFVGAVGDVFIGSSTNYVFGKVRQVGFFLDESQEDFGIDMREAVSVGVKYGTIFQYTQNYVENTLIPNFEDNRNSLLNVVNSYDDIPVNNTDKPIYYTTLKPDDPRFGSNNSDKNVWGDKAVESSNFEGPSYKVQLPSSFLESGGALSKGVFGDTVAWYNAQITKWEAILETNEKEKVQAFNDPNKYSRGNYSFDAGTTIEEGAETVDSEERTDEATEELAIIAGIDTDLKFSGAGITLNVTETLTNTFTQTETVSGEKRTAFGFTLAEDGDDDAISVDVFDSPNSHGPIFRTRGGQTSCPYEDAVVTKYYKPGTELQAKTMQIEIPKISADVTSVTGVPSGRPANFTVRIQNLSETGENVWFGIYVNDESNPDGALVTMDGFSISNGRQIYVKAGETLTKQIQISQTNDAVYDYKDIEVNLYSLCQMDDSGVFPEISSSVFLSAYFQQTSTDVRLTAQESSLNILTGPTLHLTIDDYDVNARGLKGVRLEAQQAGSPSWTTIKEWVVDEKEAAADVNKDELSKTGKIDYVLDMTNSQTFPDGTWNVRAVSFSDFGGDIVTANSEVLTIDKDMVRPQLIALPSPANGILTADGEISVTFNEDIRSGAMSKADNFYLRGVLNDAEVKHDVALNLTGGEGATTTSNINLDGKSFSLNTWLRYTEPGEVFSQGHGDKAISVSIDGEDRLVIKNGSHEIKSEQALQKGKWQFLSVAYSEEDTVVYADYAYDAYEVNLFNNEKIYFWSDNAPLTVGKGLVGQMHEVTLWNGFRSWVEAQGGMYTSKSRYTDGLIGYWKMDEGRGTLAVDDARNRNMSVAGENAWYIAGENHALKLSGNQIAAINTGAVVTDSEESYTIELWFRAEKEQTGAANIVGFDQTNKLDLGLDKKGQLKLRALGTTYSCGSTDYRDGQWHHLALNVLKSTDGSAIVYVDGAPVKQVKVNAVPSIQTAKILLGGHYNGNQLIHDEPLNGDIDEVRIWTGSRTAEVISSNMYSRVDRTTGGLVAYYPFEVITLDEGNQPVTVSTKEDRSDTKAGEVSVILGDNTLEIGGGNTPALKTAPTLQNVSFSYVGSERKLLINLTDEAQRIEGTTVNITLHGVRDSHNNTCEEINWNVYVRRNQLLWGEDEVSVRKEGDKETTFEVSFTNSSSQTESWAISGLPTWLTVNATSGALAPMGTETVTFTVDPSLAYGSYEATVRLKGSLGVGEPMVVNVVSGCEAPDWQAVPDESTMSIVGQVMIDGRMATNSDSKIAAFNGQTCVGVANLKYFSRYDASYSLINVYGDESVNGKRLTYKVFDANTCKVYTSVQSTDYNVFKYKTEANYGSFAKAVVFNTENKIEQDLSAQTTGWKWISLYVKPEDARVKAVFADADGAVAVVKSMTESKVLTGNLWTGDLGEMGQSEMYKMRADETYKDAINGIAVDPTTVDIKLASGWSWIGYPAQASNSLNAALADADPQDGDIVKGQSSFAVYTDGEWVGGLAGLTPGQGYCYFSNAQEAKTFRYPVPVQEGRNKGVRKSGLTLESETNMTMIAVVKEGNRTVSGAEVSVYAGGELVGQSNAAVIDNEHFVTIGSSDANILNFVVKTANGEVRLAQTEQFASDKMLGTIENPYVLQLSVEDCTGVDGGEIEKVELYDILGRLVAVRAKSELSNMPSGVYMKVVYFTDGTVKTVKLTK